MNKKTRVLNVLTIIEDGGMEVLVSRIYKEMLDKNEFDFYLCYLIESEDNHIKKYYREICRDVYPVNIVNKNLSLKNYFQLFISFFRIAGYIKKNKIDVVHSHDFFSAFVTRIAVITSRFLLFYKPKKNYVTVHNTLTWLNKTHNIINKLLSAVTDKIICVSESVYEYSAATDKIKSNKYRIIYNGIDTGLFKKYDGMYHSLRTELGYTKSDFLIGNISTFSVRKGHIYLMQAFKKLIEIYPNIKLVFVGSARAHEDNIASEIIAFINNNNLDNYVKIYDTRQDIFKIYNILDLYVMPSVVEGYGLALAEAMSSELIAIGSDIPAFKELIDGNNNGFLFKSKDADSLCNKMIYVISNIDKMDNVKKEARTSIIKRFSSSTMISAYYGLYNIKNN
jgi:glycosyltransferase involved in cell wall biosynthesis